MNAKREFQKTIGFVGAGLLAAALAAVVAVAVRPPDLAEFSDEGEPFFPEFTDARKATGVRVASYNPAAARTDRFEVKFTPETGWTIPSVSGYPADGEDRLSRTAASVIGVRRGGYVPAGPDDFARYGVVDPLDEAAPPEGRGSRVTLLDGERVLADYIIGRPVDEEAASGARQYYVRKADEKRVYRAELDVELSTRFADWIEPDLLKLSPTDVRQIVIDRYQVDETTAMVNQGARTVLSRPSSSAPWAMDGLGPDETLITSAVSQTLTALDDLKIVGVRPKPAIMTAQLKRAELKGFTQFDVLAMESDLRRKGFFLDNRGQLASNEGDMIVGTAEGLEYTLRFGEVFSGSEASVAGASDAGSDDSEPDESDSGDEAAGDVGEEKDAGEGGAAVDDAADDGQVRGRYLFVTVMFDEELLEGPGEPPVEPKREDFVARSDSEAADAEADEAATSDDVETDDGETGAQETDGSDDPAPSAAEKAEADYEAAMVVYRSDLAGFENAKAAYETKLKAGRERAEELSERFADWYYVIAAGTFDDLALNRADLVEPAGDAADPAAAAGSDTPDVNIEALLESAKSQMQGVVDEVTDPTADGPTADDSPADEMPPNEMPAAEAPDAETSDDETPDSETPTSDAAKGESPSLPTIEPAGDEPAGDKPASDEPAGDNPPAEEPAGDKPEG